MGNKTRYRYGSRITNTILLCGPALLCAALFAQSPVCDDARAQFKASNWAVSSESFSKCEAERPGQTDALLDRGKALINLHRFEDAADALNRYITQHPSSEDGLYTLGYVRFRQDKPRESLQAFNLAAKLKRPSDDDLKIVALDYVLLHDYDDAARYLEMALEMNPKNAEARYHLGRVRYQLNQFDQAIAAFEKVLVTEPTNIKAQDNLGLSYEAKNQIENALAAYRKAVSLDEQSLTHAEQPYIDLGSLLAKTNQSAEAVPILKHATELQINSARAQYELAKAYLNLHRFNEARIAGEAAIRLASTEGSYHYLLGRIYSKLGQQDLAAKQFKMTEELLKNKGNSSAGKVPTL